ncbi:MAG TPA: AMP-binding protein, partial [Xanthobacteraceae bacterium]|nr:AMP-binding protein [Xanthobacteraceae bacterium]
MALIEAERPAASTGSPESALRDWVRALEATAPISRNSQRLLLDVIAEHAEKRGDAPALLAAHERLTYRDLAARANAYARWALAQNLAKGDIVSLLMPNQPEYLA